MPVLGLGTWQLTDDTAGTVEEALRLGYRMIDMEELGALNEHYSSLGSLSYT